MIRLIRTEFKKIFKSKINIVLLLILVLFNGYRTFQVYHHKPDYRSDIGMRDVQGMERTGLSYWQLADQIQHSYAGILCEDTIKRMDKDFTAIIDKFPGDQLDEAKMKKMYGDNYKVLLKNARNGKYTDKEVRELFDTYITISGGYSYEEIEGSDKIRVHLQDYTKYADVRHLYSDIYGYYEEEEDKGAASTYRNYRFQEMKDWLHADQLSDKELSFIIAKDDVIEGSYEPTMNTFIHNYKTAAYNIDSNIPNTLFVQALYNLEFASLLILVIVLANTFAMEKHYKTYQIMIPTAAGNKRITTAKISAGILLALGIVLIQFLIVFIMACIFLPLRSLQLTYYSQSMAALNNVIEYVFTYRTLIINAMLLIITAVVATACMTLLASYATKNRFATVIPLFLITLITGFTGFFNQLFPGLVIDQFFPSQMIHFTQFFRIPLHTDTGEILPYFSFCGTPFAWKNTIILFWIVAVIVISICMILHSRRHVKNCC